MKNETRDNEIVDTVAAVRTMILQESLPTATTRVITSMTSKVRESSYELDSHADTCVFAVEP